MSEINTETFIVDSDVKASWVLKKIKEKKDNAAELIDFHKAKIKEIEDETAFEVATLERMLRPYFDGVKHKVTKTEESYTLPGGKIYIKKQNPEIKRDDKTVIAFLEKNGGQFIKTTKSLDWDGLKKTGGVVGNTFVNEDGEIIPGIEVVEREDKFVVDVK